MIANAFFSVVLRKRLIKFRSLVISVGFKSAEFERFQNFLCLELFHIAGKRRISNVSVG